MFEKKVCGNGICEPPEEYPGFGRFGCVSDCGRYLQRTPIRIDLAPAWKAKPGGIDLPAFVMGAGDSADLNFSFNVYSDTMQDYLLAKDSDRTSAILDVPDGNLWLELYQQTTVGLDVPRDAVAEYAMAMVTPALMRPNKAFDYQYGLPSEAIAATALVNQQLHQYCTMDSDGSAAFAGCPAQYNPYAMAKILRRMYGLNGSVSVERGATRTTLLTVPFCSLNPATPAADAQATLAQGLCVKQADGTQVRLPPYLHSS